MLLVTTSFKHGNTEVLAQDGGRLAQTIEHGQNIVAA